MRRERMGQAQRCLGALDPSYERQRLHHGLGLSRGLFLPQAARVVATQSNRAVVVI